MTNLEKLETAIRSVNGSLLIPTALYGAKNKHGHSIKMVKCKCACGNEANVKLTHLTNGNTKSCGCLNSYRRKNKISGHGKTNSKIYSVWLNIKQRCYNANSTNWHNYGGRGIKMSDRWKDFNKFYADVGDAPDKKELDRIDVNGDYEPNNVRWVTRSENMRNTRLNAKVEFEGKVWVAMELCEVLKIKRQTLNYYRNKPDNIGMPIQDFLSNARKKLFRDQSDEVINELVKLVG